MPQQDRPDQKFEGFSVDVTRKVLVRGGEIVDLPPKAVEMLIVLLRNRGKVVTKQELLDSVWGDTFVEESVLSNNVYMLRKAIGQIEPGRQLIRTIPRRGYKFEDSFDGPSSEFVLEHHVFEQTLIEDVSRTEPAEESVRLAAPSKRYWLNYKGLAAAMLVVVALAGAAVWRWDRTPSRPPMDKISSVAVLPIGFLGGEDQDALGMRLTDTLITKLGKVESLVVRPTTSVAYLANVDVEPVDIGRTLKVDTVLLGNAQRENDKIRLTLRLISTADGSQIWSEQFDGDGGRLLAFQDVVGGRLFQAFHLDDSQAEKANRRTTSSDSAFEEFTRGRYFWNKRTPADLKKAIHAFEAAVAIDPNYADAHAYLGDSHVMLWDYGYDTAEENVKLAALHAERAIALEPNSPDAYVTLSVTHGTFHHDWKKAEASLTKALELAPNSASAHHRYGVLLMRLRRFDEAETQLAMAKSLDPSSPGINMNYGVVALFSNRLDEARMRLERTVELDQNFSAPRWYLARTMRMQGKMDEALTSYASAMRADGDTSTASLIDGSNGVSDNDERFRQWSDSWDSQIGQNGINEHDLAMLAAYRGDREGAIKWLGRSVDANHPWTSMIAAEPEFDFIREDPRFKAILARLDLPA
jgi:DNA-binding winged helix-turn-helix (wHTH) protein/TolB-like protein